MIQEVTEALIRLFQAKVHEHTLLIVPDDVFEVKKTPSILLQGPMLSEDRHRRVVGTTFKNNLADMTAEESSHPRLYHLDFDLIVTTAHESELLNFQERIAAFFISTPVVEIAESGALNLTEISPLGSLSRVNLSNLKQSSGKIRIEDCPVFAGELTTGKLVSKINIQLSPFNSR